MFNQGGMNPMPSVMKHDFSRVPKAEIPRSSFNRSHGHKTTFDAGYLVPVYVDEALPGDTFNMNMSAFARMATPLHPIMDNMYLETFFFAVPFRLVWDNFQKFMGEQVDPGDSTDYLVPNINFGVSPPSEGSIWDYFGLPFVNLDTTNVSALPFRAYNLIYNEWFRDQNLIDSLTVARTDGPDSPGLYSLKRRGKRHDYFTSCLPWPQKGDAVSLPLGLAEVKTQNSSGDFNVGIRQAGTSDYFKMDIDASGFATFISDDNNIANMFTNETSATINDLREAFQIQKLLERDARGGTRYTEIIQAHFGVTSDDARLQRPEYLGGGKTPIYVSPIPQTSSTDATTPQGNLAAVGTGSFSGHGFTKSFTEHNIIIGLVSVRADLTYQQGLNRMWSRQGRYDFYWPSLAHLGEQAVLNKEIYTQGTAADEDVFGYQERYAEYRYKPSQISGVFRSDAAASLDSWHLSQDFGSLPLLNQSFIEENPPIDRVIATPGEPHFIFDSFFNLKCARPMPVYAVPGLIDHF